MIFGNVKNLDEFGFLDDAIKECFEYARLHDLANYEKGCHEIDGKRLFVNIVEYTTCLLYTSGRQQVGERAVVPGHHDACAFIQDFWNKHGCALKR